MANITGRDDQITAKALTYAISAIQSLPAAQQEFSDMCDMCELLVGRFTPSAIAEQICIVYSRTGNLVDILAPYRGENGDVQNAPHRSVLVDDELAQVVKRFDQGDRWQHVVPTV